MAIHEGCHLISIIGGKGGVGKSVFAANLACALQAEMRAKTLMIDADSKSCGDQNFIFGLRPQKVLGEIADYSGTVSPTTLPTLITPHPSGIHFIGAVQGVEQTLNADPQLLMRQISQMSQFYKFIVCDLGTEVTELQLSFIENSSALVVVTTPEVLVVNQTKRLLNDLLTATVPSSLFQVVINKATKNGLSPQVISQNLRCPVIGQIPQDDLLANNALQRSTPMALLNPQAPVIAAHHDVVRKLTGGILQKLKAMSRPKNLKATQGQNKNLLDSGQGGSNSTNNKGLSPLKALKTQIHTELIKEMDLKKDLMNTKEDPSKKKELQTKTQRVITQLVDKLGQGLSRDERSQVIKEVLQESLGLGPLEDLLADPTVTEIMVNGANMIYIEKSGKLTLSPVTFTSNLQLRNVIERIVTPLGRRIDEKTPYVDARLEDGSRVNAIIEPLSIDGPAVTIRKFPTDRIVGEDYVKRFKSMTQPMLDFLRICVEQGLNIVISGGTGSGKTTLLNVMSSYIPSNERIITVEDAAELQLKQEHVVRLETRPANMEGSGEISIRDLIKNSLRMRPDRIVVGECRDGAALDMLSAMNTGHDGSMTTVHANNPREAVARLETLCMMAGMDLPAKAIREQVASAVNLIIQISRLSDGSRKILSITEVVGMQGETVTLQEIFRFKEEGFDKNRKIIGQFQPMGMIPTFIEKFEQRGVSIPRNLFTGGGVSTQSSPQPGSDAGKSGLRPVPRTPVRRPHPTTSSANKTAQVPLKKASGGENE